MNTILTKKKNSGSGYFCTLPGVIIIFAFVCCTPNTLDKIAYIDYSITAWENANFSSLNKFDQMMESFEDILSIFLDKNLTFRVSSITYPTLDPNGDALLASGLVYHPINKKSKGVILFLPMAHLDRMGGTSEQLYVAEGILALLGYTVIIPDLIGSGASKDRMVPFLMVENTGRVTYDMYRASGQYLWDQFGFSLPSESTIMGYSLGGSAALATQKYFETLHSNTVKVREVYAGGGPYDLIASFEASANSGISEYPAIPHMILAFDHYYNLELQYDKIFSGDLLKDDNYKTWLHGEYDSDILKNLLGTDLFSYMHIDFFKPFGSQNAEFEKFYPHLKENSVTEGWHPKAPIYLFHSRNDHIVPVAAARSAVKKFRKMGANISLTEYPGDHYTVGYLYFVRTMIKHL